VPSLDINKNHADRTRGEKLVCSRIEVRTILHLIRCVMCVGSKRGAISLPSDDPRPCVIYLHAGMVRALALRATDHVPPFACSGSDWNKLCF